MAEQTTRDRLQPSLLDRLTDDEPERKTESRERRVMTMQQLRAAVLRDLAWLMNTSNLSSLEDLDDYPQTASSVVNFGMPDMTGVTVSGIDRQRLTRALRQAILDFEPRILAATLEVHDRSSEAMIEHNRLVFEVEGELWGQQGPQRLYLKTEVDLESGDTIVSESAGTEPR